VNPVDDLSVLGKRISALSPLARIYALAIAAAISVALSLLAGTYWGFLWIVAVVAIAMAPVDRLAAAIVRRYREKTPPDSV
jgi:hypothetical protein